MNLVFVFGLLLGLLVGWIIELIIDWRFWRQEDDVVSDVSAALQSELSAAQAKISSLEAALAEASAASAAESRSAPVTTVTKSADRLEKIHGIGKVFASRFNDAGVFTFADVAALTPDSIIEIVGVTESWRKIDPEAWIAEAAELAKKS